MLPRALTIAGSDSGGGAGIQADIKTFTVFGVFGMTAVTALTAQNTCGIQGIHAVPASFVRQQVDSVLADIGADAVKTGMLVNAEIVRSVAAVLRDHAVANLVVDPVIAAGTGTGLLAPDALQILRGELIPLSTLVTPNLAEAEALSGIRIASVGDMHRAADKLLERGARACLVKGGHLAGDRAVDVLHDAQGQCEFSTARLPSRHTHGTGCQLSAAITANLAAGRSLRDSVEEAKRFISAAVAQGLAIGKGVGPANPLAWIGRGTKDA